MKLFFCVLLLGIGAQGQEVSNIFLRDDSDSSVHYIRAIFQREKAMSTIGSLGLLLVISLWLGRIYRVLTEIRDELREWRKDD